MKFNITKIALVGTLAVTLSACVTTKEAMDPALKAETKAAVEKLFAKKDVVPKLKRRCEKEVVKITLSKLRKGFEELDIAKIEPYLAKKFQYKFRVSQEKFTLENREEFLKARKEWKGKAKGRKAIYKIEGVTVNKEQTSAVVSSFVSVETKYFAPHLIEILTFTKEKGKWKVLEQAQIPLYPNKNIPDLQEANVFLGQALKDEEGKVKPQNFVKEFSNSTLAKGPDYALDNIKALEKIETKFGGVERKADLVVAFKEPPAIGSDITVKVKQDCSSAKRLYQKVNTASPYFVMSGQLKVKACANSINVKVELDGLKITEKDIVVPK